MPTQYDDDKVFNGACTFAGAVSFDGEIEGVATTDYVDSAVDGLASTDYVDTAVASRLRRYIVVIGDGVETVFAITHGLNSLGIIVIGYDTGTGDIAFVPPFTGNVTVVDANNVTLTLLAAPAENGLRIVIHG